MEKYKIPINDFISRVRNEVNDISSSFSQAASQYQYIRRYSYFLGGLVLAIVEQSIILKKDNTLTLINQEWIRMDSRQQKRQYLQSFIYTIKRILLTPSQQKLSEFNQELNNNIFLMGAETWAREILLSSKKFSDQQAELAKTPFAADSFLYASQFPAINILSDLFKVDIVLLKMDEQTRQLSYTNFRSQKFFSVTVYVLQTILYSCLSSKPLATQLGDGFPSEIQLKERTAAMTKAQIKERDSQTAENNGDRIGLDTSSNHNQLFHGVGNKQDLNMSQEDQSKTKLCNKCNKLTAFKSIFMNPLCGHAFCADCLISPIYQSLHYSQIRCFLMSCSKSINVQQVKTFLENIQPESKESTENTEASIRLSSSEPSSSMNNQTVQCSSCNKIVSTKNCFKKQDCHCFCYECIERLCCNSISQHYVSCPCCGKLLQKDKIRLFIAQNKGSSGNAVNNSIPSQDFPVDSHKETNLATQQQQKPFSELTSCICDRCKGCNLQISDMFSPDGCTHRICIDCVKAIRAIIEKSNSYYYQCNLLPPCSGQIRLSKIYIYENTQNGFLDQFKNKDREIKIALDSISNNNNNKISSNSIENGYAIEDPKNEYMNDSGSSYNNQITNASNNNNVSRNMHSSEDYCDICQRKNKKENLFKNSQCAHFYCLICIEKSLSIPYLSMCQVKYCRKQLDVTGMDNFYVIQLAQQNEQLEGSKKTFDHKVTCSNCKASGTIVAAEAPEYFKCTSCQKTTCLKHNVLVSACKCFCEKCGSQFKQEGKIKSCAKCNLSFCSTCNKADCRCGKCEFCGHNKQGQLCNCLENICCFCLNEFEDVQLNSKKETFLRQQSICVHLFCNPCHFKKISQDAQQECLFCISN